MNQSRQYYVYIYDYIAKNGLYYSYEKAFSVEFCKNYNMTDRGLLNIINAYVKNAYSPLMDIVRSELCKK